MKHLAARLERFVVRQLVALPARQLLIYPQLDAAGDTPSLRLFESGFVREREDCYWFDRGRSAAEQRRVHRIDGVGR